MIHLAASHESTSQSLSQFETSLRQARHVPAGEGLEAILVRNLAMLDRFVAGNIQVRTGRTKNSVFQSVSSQGNRAQAGLHTNVIYAPHVGHVPKKSSEQFFKYAARVEGPKVAQATGGDIVVIIEDKFR